MDKSVSNTLITYIGLSVDLYKYALLMQRVAILCITQLQCIMMVMTVIVVLLPIP